jgi:hypothetical protein
MSLSPEEYLHSKVDFAMNMETQELLRELAQNAESVCRHYLSAGRREGGYWLVGDLQNTPGRSLYVRLTGPDEGKGARGRWTDGATGEYGDLLDIIEARTGIVRFPDLLTEARAHLGRPMPVARSAAPRKRKAAPSKRTSAKRLYEGAVPILGSLADTYLRSRGIMNAGSASALRFHPRCWHRDHDEAASKARPALVAAVTDRAGRLRGVHRTWLAEDGSGKAPVEVQRRAMGELLGNAVKIDAPGECLVIGEGLETMLSFREALPGLPVWAALSAAHLGAVDLPKGVRQLYIARDLDDVGWGAAEKLSMRARDAGISVSVLEPRLGDFNDDLREDGAAALRQRLIGQLERADLAGIEVKSGTS